MYKKIKIAKDVREHLATHFQQDLPGSKFYSESPEDLLNMAQQLFPETFSNARPDADGRIRISLTFPDEIGVSNVVNIEELTEEERNRIVIVDRQGKKVRSVKTDRVIPTHECQIILSEDWHLITMFPGEMAPPLPDSPDIHDEYWDNHVFIELEEKKELADSGGDDPQNMIIYRTPDGKISVALYAKDGKIWLNQQQMATLFATSKQTVSYHILNILKEKELKEKSVVKEYLTTAADGKSYNVVYYSLEMIIAVGYRVRGFRGTQFRQWATEHLTEYLVKGFTMDDERLKNPDGRPDYFDELLARIRDIRASEKRFYQKVRDLFALSSDYDKTDKATQMFFAETQNKLLYAVTHQTAAEIVVSRADASKPNMGLTTWKGTIVRKGDVIIAKNYLTQSEINSLNRLVEIFIASAEERVEGRRDLTLQYWRNNVDRLLLFQDKDILQGKGSVSNAEMEDVVKREYDEFDQRRKQIDAQQADIEDLKLLENLERRIIEQDKKKQ